MHKLSDELDRRLNDFAARSFRNMADRDYIAARMALRAQLMPQFLWAAQQAIEKYLKYILLVNRIEAKVGHDISAAFQLTEKLPFKIDLRPKSRAFVDHVARYGQYRYLDISYFVEGHALVHLDMAVWDLRRFCQVLDVFGKRLPPVEQRMLDESLALLKTSTDRPPHAFRINGGFLEKVLESKAHPARAGLVWQNGFFGSRRRLRVKSRHYLNAENSPLYLFPEMLDELLKYVYIPKELRDGYRKHLKAILEDPTKRP